MTLAQIFTLATVSGSIKTALDALSALIATNKSNISTLSTTKLNTVGGIRTGLTANRNWVKDGLKPTREYLENFLAEKNFLTESYCENLKKMCYIS